MTNILRKKFYFCYMLFLYFDVIESFLSLLFYFIKLFFMILVSMFSFIFSSSYSYYLLRLGPWKLWIRLKRCHQVVLQLSLSDQWSIIAPDRVKLLSRAGGWAGTDNNANLSPAELNCCWNWNWTGLSLAMIWIDKRKKHPSTKYPHFVCFSVGLVRHLPLLWWDLKGSSLLSWINISLNIYSPLVENIIRAQCIGNLHMQ